MDLVRTSSSGTEAGYFFFAWSNGKCKGCCVLHAIFVPSNRVITVQVAILQNTSAWNNRNETGTQISFQRPIPVACLASVWVTCQVWKLFGCLESPPIWRHNGGPGMIFEGGL